MTAAKVLVAAPTWKIENEMNTAPVSCVASKDIDETDFNLVKILREEEMVNIEHRMVGYVLQMNILLELDQFNQTPFLIQRITYFPRAQFFNTHLLKVQTQRLQIPATTDEQCDVATKSAIISENDEYFQSAVYQASGHG